MLINIELIHPLKDEDALTSALFVSHIYCRGYNTYIFNNFTRKINVY